MANFFKSALCVILSLILWLLGSTVLGLLVFGLLALLGGKIPLLADLIIRITSSKYFDGLIPMVIRGVPMLLSAWVTSKILNHSKKSYLVSCIITVTIILALQTREVIIGEGDLLWLIAGAMAQIVAVSLVKSEQYD